MAVYAIVVVHLVSAAAATVVFACRTRYSAQGNHWHALAQVASDETAMLIEHSTRATDADVGRLLLRDGDPRGARGTVGRHGEGAGGEAPVREGLFATYYCALLAPGARYCTAKPGDTCSI